MENMGLSRSHIYFKIRLHKFLSKYPLLKSCTLPQNYFKTHFRLIKKVCTERPYLLGKKHQQFYLIQFFLDFSSVARILFCLDSFSVYPLQPGVDYLYPLITSVFSASFFYRYLPKQQIFEFSVCKNFEARVFLSLEN